MQIAAVAQAAVPPWVWQVVAGEEANSAPQQPPAPGKGAVGEGVAEQVVSVPLPQPVVGVLQHLASVLLAQSVPRQPPVLQVEGSPMV